MYARLRHLGSTLFILGVSITALSFVATSGRKAIERGPSGEEDNAALPRLRLLSLALLSVRMEGVRATRRVYSVTDQERPLQQRASKSSSPQCVLPCC